MALKKTRKAGTSRKATPASAPVTTRRKKSSRRSSSAPRSSSSTSSKNFDLKASAMDMALTGGAMLGGILIAGYLDKKVLRPATKEVSGLMGVSTDYSKYVAPLVFIGAGMAVGHFAKNQHLKNAGIGLGVYGGIKTAELFLNKPVLTIAGLEDEPVRGIQGADEDALRKALEIAMATPAQVSGNENTETTQTTQSVQGIGEVGDVGETNEVGDVGEIAPETVGDITDMYISGSDEFGDIEGSDEFGDIEGLDGDGEPVNMY